VAGHLVKLEIEGSVEVSEPMQDVRGDLGVGPALRLPQAPRPAAPLRLLQAGETFGLVEVEVLVRHHTFEPQEVLNPAHLARRVRHQALAADEEEARQWEEAQPVLQVLGVDADAHGAPGCVDEARGGIAEGQVLEGREPGRFGQSLGVVGHGPGHGVTHHHDEFGVAAYGEDAARGLLSDEVTGGFLHGDLTLQGTRHQVPARRRKEEKLF